MDKGEEKKKKKKKGREEGRRKEKRRSKVWNLLGTFVWIFVWICIRLLVWRFRIPIFCVESLFGMVVDLVVVLNGGKICIEKMLGFREDDVRFF